MQEHAIWYAHISERMRELPNANGSARGEPSYGYHGIRILQRGSSIPKVEIVLIVVASFTEV